MQLLYITYTLTQMYIPLRGSPQAHQGGGGPGLLGEPGSPIAR